VTVSADSGSADSVWFIDHVDPNYRFEHQGEVVQASDPVLIRHVQTSKYLAADNSFKVKNDFGTELEMHCSQYSTFNKS